MENNADHWHNEANKLDPNWSQAFGKVHDWRNYVGSNIQRLWPTLPFHVRYAIVLDAQEEAGMEDHD